MFRARVIARAYRVLVFLALKTSRLIGTVLDRIGQAFCGGHAVRGFGGSSRRASLKGRKLRVLVYTEEKHRGYDILPLGKALRRGRRELAAWLAYFTSAPEPRQRVLAAATRLERPPERERERERSASVSGARARAERERERSASGARARAEREREREREQRWRAGGRQPGRAVGREARARVRHRPSDERAGGVRNICIRPHGKELPLGAGGGEANAVSCSRAHV